jgi:hypothetical protein
MKERLGAEHCTTSSREMMLSRNWYNNLTKGKARVIGIYDLDLSYVIELVILQ